MLLWEYRNAEPICVKNVDVRFIELMPFDGNEWDTRNFISYMEVIDRLKKEKVSCITLLLKLMVVLGVLGNRIGSKSATCKCCRHFFEYESVEG